MTVLRSTYPCIWEVPLSKTLALTSWALTSNVLMIDISFWLGANCWRLKRMQAIPCRRSVEVVWARMWACSWVRSACQSTYCDESIQCGFEAFLTSLLADATQFRYNSPGGVTCARRQRLSATAINQSLTTIYFVHYDWRYFMSRCYSIAWDRLDRWRLSVCLSVIAPAVAILNRIWCNVAQSFVAGKPRSSSLWVWIR